MLRLFALVLVAACGDDTAPPPADAGAPDGGSLPCTPPAISFVKSRVAAVPGVVRAVRLRLARDACEDFTIELASADPFVATVPPSLSLARGHAETTVEITADGAGTTQIVATVAAGGVMESASIDVFVGPPELPACDGSAAGRVDAGTTLAVAAGTIAGASIRLPEGAARDDRYHADGFDARIDCASDAVPEGYTALGPAVRFGPGLRFMREIPITIPIRDGLLPQGAHTGHIEVAYSGPGIEAPRIVPVAFASLDGGFDALLTFEAPRLGTYRAVMRVGAGTATMRDVLHRAIVGVSMGGFGTGSVGFRHADLFDVIAPLGAAWDLAYILDYIHDFHLGGFCTEAERVADPAACTNASSDRVPPARFIHEHTQDYEHWFNDERQGGPGASFSRNDYLDIFTDLSMMFGNPNTDRSLDPLAPNVTPPGVPDTERMRPNAERCAAPFVIAPYDGTPGTGYFDDEYNPEGAHPVITFCEGGEVEVGGMPDHGVWDPLDDNDRPLDVALAVDVNANGVRDPGEPVIRSGGEPFEDCGLDRLCNDAEPGYDATTNPDPAGDDYDYQYDPTGTEGNMVRDGDACDLGGEIFSDAGLDGVDGTAQLDAGGFDRGEDNDCWDLAQGSRAMLENGPRALLRAIDDDELARVAIFGDGGIRDLFNGGVAANHTFGALPARSSPLRYFNSHAGLMLDGRWLDDDLDMNRIVWDELGSKLLIRYGDPDTSAELFARGDGAHVGTMGQAVNRMLTALRFIDARWPDGDRSVVRDTLCGAECTSPTQFTLDFTASSGRTGPVSIVLPPGYYQEAFAEMRYPVVYFLHGYGMQPMDLVVTSVLFWAFMTSPTSPEWERLQKMIFVFPDGHCRNGECAKGTFWQNAPRNAPVRALMDDFVLDVIEHVDANFRTRGPETRLVVD